MIKTIPGTAIPINGNDIDTDRIVPARFLKEITFDRMGEYLFYDVRFDGDKIKPHPLNDAQFKGASIMIVNKNFGCGSSREHAPQAIKRYGIKAIIGESFAEIFSGNCKELGIPILTAPQNEIKKLQKIVENQPDLELTIDIKTKTVQVYQQQISLMMSDERQSAFLNGTWDSTEILRSNQKLINQLAKQLPYIHNFQ